MDAEVHSLTVSKYFPIESEADYSQIMVRCGILISRLNEKIRQLMKKGFTHRMDAILDPQKMTTRIVLVGLCETKENKEELEKIYEHVLASVGGID